MGGAAFYNVPEAFYAMGRESAKALCCKARKWYTEIYICQPETEKQAC